MRTKQHNEELIREALGNVEELIRRGNKHFEPARQLLLAEHIELTRLSALLDMLDSEHPEWADLEDE